MNIMNEDSNSPVVLPHHVPGEFCRTRASYRQGRKLTAVKVPSRISQVYTVSKESSHLLIFNVPAINLSTELKLLCERFGKLKLFEKLSKELKLEEFTDVFHVNYIKVPSARYAKKNLDNRSFYGGFLHVCYAPERETLEETRLKLITRRNEIAIRTGRKIKTKNTIPISSNSLNRKRPYNSGLIEAGVSGISVPNKVLDVDLTIQPVLHQIPTKLIPTSIFRKPVSPKKAQPKKVPRIIFHKNNNSEAK